MNDQILIGLSPCCLDCDDFKPVVKDNRESIFEDQFYEKRYYMYGNVLFACQHFKVCKKASDSGKTLALAEGEASYESMIKALKGIHY